MTAACDSVPIVHGHNRWVLARTDRDAPDLEDVKETASAFLSRVLGKASPTGQRSIFEALAVPDTDSSRYVIGAARPVTIRAAQPATVREALDLSLPREGNVLANYTQCSETRAVKAQRPWLVWADFDWRGPSKTIPWPTRKVSDSLFEYGGDDDQELDWLLLFASDHGQAIESDTSLAREVSAATRKQLQRALEGVGDATKTIVWMGLGVGALTLGFQFYKSRKKGRRK